MNDSIRRDDMKPRDPLLNLTPKTRAVLRTAAMRGAADLTPAQVAEIGREWIMVGGKQVAIRDGRAFRL